MKPCAFLFPVRFPSVVWLTLVLLFSVLLIAGCASRKRCLRKWGRTETIIHRDTLLVRPATRFDTLWPLRPGSLRPEIPTPRDTLWRTRRDTFEFERERLRLRLVRVHDTVRVQAECRADTVRVPQLITRTVFRESDAVGWSAWFGAWPFWLKWGWIPLLVLALTGGLLRRWLRG